MDRVVKSFMEFVQIDSPTGEEKAFSDYLAKKIQALGVRPTQDERGNIFVSLPGVGRSLFMAAHIDTVEPGRGIKPVIQNGIIKSSGDTILGADNKAIVAALFELIRTLVSTKKKHRPLEILFSVSEESGISGIDTFNFSRVKAAEGLCFDAGKPLGTIITGSPYYLSQTIEIKGKVAHPSRPEKGISVVPVLGQILSAIPQGRIQEKISINTGTVKAGHGINSIMGNALIKGEIRAFDYKELQKYRLRIKNIVMSAAQGTGCRVAYADKLENDGYDFSSQDPFIKFLVNHLGRFVSQKSIQLMPNYWGISDANNLNRKGIKTVNLGYGSRDAHTTKESVPVAALEKVERFMLSLAMKNE